MCVAGALLHAAVHLVVQQRLADDLQLALEHRQFDVLPLARAIAMAQRGDRRERGERAGVVVAVVVRGLHRAAVGVAR